MGGHPVGPTVEHRGSATVRRHTDIAREFLEDAEKAMAMKARLGAIRDLLGSQGASDTAAAIVLKYLQRREN